MTLESEMAAATIDVPSRGRKWRTGAIVRDGAILYRVTSSPQHYHEDCLAVQRVCKVRDIPEHWQRVTRLLAILEQVRAQGQHTPSSRGAYGRPAEQIAELPSDTGAWIGWEARQDTESHASYPCLRVRGEVVCYVEPIYDDSPVECWIRNATLAQEIRSLIAQQPILTRYPRVSVRA